MTERAAPTRDELEVAFAAWLASRNGNGIVIHDDAYPAAHALAEKGWLQRRFEPDGEMSWHWTKEGDTALHLGGLINDTDTRRN